MSTIPYIAGGAAALIGGAYLLLRGDKQQVSATPETLDQAIGKAQKSSGAVVGAAQQEAAQAKQMTAEDEEYNMARENYRMIAGTYPPASWTIAMIQSWIAEQKKKNEAIKSYLELVSSNADYTTKQDTSEMTYSEIMALISATQNEVDSNKESARLQKVKNQAQQLAKAFRATLVKPNYFNLALKAQNAWDVATLQAMLNLDDEGKSWCEYYFRSEGPVTLPGYFNQVKKSWKSYSSIYESILDSNTCTGRRDSSYAIEVKKAYMNVVPAASNATGFRAKSPRSVAENVIRFNLLNQK